MHAPEVFIDGEKVVFEGTLPATLGELRDLLERVLGGGGRVLAALTIDGREFRTEFSGTPLAEAARIEAASMTIAAARERLRAASVASLAQARQFIQSLAAEVLRLPWDEAVGSCIRAAEMLGAVLQDLPAATGELSPDHPVARAADELTRSLEQWMDAVQARDAAAVCLRSDSTVLPALARLGGSLATLSSGAEAT